MSLVYLKDINNMFSNLCPSAYKSISDIGLMMQTVESALRGRAKRIRKLTDLGNLGRGPYVLILCDGDTRFSAYTANGFTVQYAGNSPRRAEVVSPTGTYFGSVEEDGRISGWAYTKKVITDRRFANGSSGNIVLTPEHLRSGAVYVTFPRSRRLERRKLHSSLRDFVENARQPVIDIA